MGAAGRWDVWERPNQDRNPGRQRSLPRSRSTCAMVTAEQAGDGDGLGVGGPSFPGAAGVAVRDPQGVQCRAEGIVVVFSGAEQGGPGRSG
jgi:hypothetical protein